MTLVRSLLLAIVFAAGLVLVFLGQRMTGYPGLGILLIGLAMLLLDLYLYNRRYNA